MKPSSMSDVNTCAPERIGPLPPASGGLQRRSNLARLLPQLSAWLVVGWGLVEMPFEIGYWPDRQQVSALICTQFLLAFLVLAMGRNKSWARFLFLAVCATSIFAVAPGLASQATTDPTGATLSTVECFLKLVALGVIGFRRSTGARHA